MEQRLIDADALIKWINGTECFMDVFKRVTTDIINKQPTVDAVQVVRCLDCKYYGEEYGSCGRTDIIRSDMRIIMPYWYCADGERKDDENN